MGRGGGPREAPSGRAGVGRWQGASVGRYASRKHRYRVSQGDWAQGGAKWWGRFFSFVDGGAEVGEIWRIASMEVFGRKPRQADGPACISWSVYAGCAEVGVQMAKKERGQMKAFRKHRLCAGSSCFCEWLRLGRLSIHLCHLIPCFPALHSEVSEGLSHVRSPLLFMLLHRDLSA
jgi:hypothetical protein